MFNYLGYNNPAIPVINSATSSTRYASQPQSNFQALHIAVSMDHSDSSDDESYSQLQSPQRWMQQKNTILPQKSSQKIGMCACCHTNFLMRNEKVFYALEFSNEQN